MKQILFVDACMRGPELSRTSRLCRSFLEEFTARCPDSQVSRRDLTDAKLPLLTGELAAQRDAWVKQGEEHPLLAPAREGGTWKRRPATAGRRRRGRGIYEKASKGRNRFSSAVSIGYPPFLNGV